VSAAPGARGKGARLVGFAGCGDLLDYMKQNALHSVTASGFLGHQGVEAVGPVGPSVQLPPGVTALPAPTHRDTARETPSSAGDDFSTTNVQEAGVDEPDIVKSNGSTLFALARGSVHAIDVGGERPRRLDSLAVKSGANQHELLLHKGALLVLSYDHEEADPRRALQSSFPTPHPLPPPPKTTLTQIDVSKPGSMKVLQRLTFEGRYLSARLVRGSARVVFTSSVPNDLHFFRPRHYAFPQEALERNRAVIASSRAANWLPSYELRNVRTKAKASRSVQCRHVSRPPVFSGFGMLTVLTIDLDQGLEPVETDAILGDGEIVYASEASLYVATQRWPGQPVPGLLSAPPTQATSLHKFDISPPTRTAYRASGVVTGNLLNQWSLSEHDGVLRVASTKNGAAESLVTTFRERSGELVELGHVSGLGRGERIFGVRFIGDVGYVVTFRQTDPLYTIDLSSPDRPRRLGELKIPGYSAYLHPAGENLLLGLGQDATGEGMTFGTQLSVFDVSDVKKPIRLHRRTIEGGSSEAESDHHAFLYWGRERLAVVPLQTYSPARLFEGVVGFRVGRDRLEEVGRVEHSSGGPIRRTLVARGRLITVSETGVRASDLRTFRNEGWIAFP
jgi:hypothetical protein